MTDAKNATQPKITPADAIAGPFVALIGVGALGISLEACALGAALTLLLGYRLSHTRKAQLDHARFAPGLGGFLLQITRLRLAVQSAVINSINHSTNPSTGPSRSCRSSTRYRADCRRQTLPRP